jgi:FAD:protein FMN transferase
MRVRPFLVFGFQFSVISPKKESFAGFMGRKKTRREFLQVSPSDHAQSSDQRQADSGPPGSVPDSQDTGLMTNVSRLAMSCRFEVRFPGAMRGTAGRHEQDAQLAVDALESLEGLEGQLSFFNPGSHISRINLLAAERPVEVDPELFKLLCLAKDIWRETDGALDVTSAPLWELWGFARREGTVPNDEQIADALSRVGFNFVQLDSQQNTVQFSRAGMKLNLGAIGKGFAVDRCAARLIQGGMEHFLLHAGQSSIFAHGGEKRGTGTSSEPVPFFSPFWTIGIPHPYQPDRCVAEIHLRNRAIGTSSSQFQSFRHEGKSYGHIIDPRNGRPAAGLLAATVVAQSSTLADALSTAFFVLGAEKSLAYCRNHPEIGAVLITPTDRGGNIEIHRSGLDDCDLIVN